MNSGRQRRRKSRNGRASSRTRRSRSISIDTTVFIPDLTLASPASAPAAHVVAVSGQRIVAVGERASVVPSFPGARVEALPGCLLTAGFVNAHQHGRGLSQIQLGYPDDYLEAWISSRRGRGVLEAYPITKLAAANML